MSPLPLTPGSRKIYLAAHICHLYLCRLMFKVWFVTQALRRCTVIDNTEFLTCVQIKCPNSTCTLFVNIYFALCWGSLCNASDCSRWGMHIKQPYSDCSDISQKSKPGDLTLMVLYFFLPKKRNVIVFSILYYHLGLLNEPCVSYKSCFPGAPPHTVLLRSFGRPLPLCFLALF